MKLWGTPILFFLFSLFSSFFFVPEIQADNCNIQLSSPGADGVYTIPSESVVFSSSDVRANDGDTLITSTEGQYFIDVLWRGSAFQSTTLPININNGSFSINVDTGIETQHRPLGGEGQLFDIKLIKNLTPGSAEALNRETVCAASVRATVQEAPAQYSCNNPQVNLSRIGTETVNVAITVDGSELDSGRSYYAVFQRNGQLGSVYTVPLSKDGSAYTNGIQSRITPGDYTLAVIDDIGTGIVSVLPSLVPDDHQECITGFTIPDPITQLPEDEDPDFCPVGEECDDEFDETPFELCRQAGENFNACNDCFEGKGQFSGNGEGIWTAVGCIPYKAPSGDATTSVTLMLRSFITIGLGIAGGVVVLMVLAGSFLLSTSQGDPKRVDEGKSLISSAVIGILFIIFSVSILRFIGVDILQIPGFGR